MIIIVGHSAISILITIISIVIYEYDAKKYIRWILNVVVKNDRHEKWKSK